ncbi:hypothetical protein MMS66_27845 [Escherichia coli]|nr:hypothetical protein [Escherichia coli]MCM4455385.1 hypothetical protein [Escherichia coli]MCM4695121.1 hypothetical protein [Escherichia coli]MCM5465246.1 hypothetical protein [Escherichia coli]
MCAVSPFGWVQGHA